MRLVSLALALAAVALSPLACRNPFSDESIILAVSQLEAPPYFVRGITGTFVLTVGVNGCERFDRVSQMRVNSQIVLTAVGTNSGLGDKSVSCPAALRTEQHSVVIDQPLPRRFTVFVRVPSGGTALRAEIYMVDTIDPIE